MSTAYNELTEIQKHLYGAISFGGSDGFIVPSDTLGSNKWVGLRANTAGTLHLRMANGQDRVIEVAVGENLPWAIDTLYATGGTTGSIEVTGGIGWDELIEDVYE